MAERPNGASQFDVQPNEPATRPLAETLIVREGISDEELGNLVSAIGNHEAKAIIFGLMVPTTAYGVSDSHKMVMDAQVQSLGWVIDRRAPFQFMEDSFVPNGLAQEVAGLLLDFSLRYPQTSLRDLFGSTHLSVKSLEGQELKKRAPTTSRKILRALVASPLPTSAVAIARAIGEYEDTGNIVPRHLSDLSEKHIIVYSARDSSGPFSLYSLNPDHPAENPPAHPKVPTVGQFVWNKIQETPNKQWTSKELAKLYIGEYPDKKFASSKTVPDYMKSVLSFLIKTGYLRKEGVPSSITMSNEQRNMLLDLLSVLDKFQNQDQESLLFGKKRLREILSDPTLVSSLLRKAKEHSPDANSVPSEESLAQILTIIRGHPNITQAEVRQQLADIQGRTLKIRRTYELLNSLVRSGEIRVSTEERINRYIV
jgi:DNA-binding transcriptional ArsR family regulator